MARWQAVHRQGRAVHLAHADRQERGAGVSSQPAQGVVLETPGRQHQRRVRGNLRTERAAAQPAGAAGERFFGGVSLPRSASDHAHQANRHRPLQVCRIQTRRLDPSGAQSRLLEKRSSLSGRDHLQDDRQPRHAHVGFRDRRIRHHLPRRCQRFPDERHQGAGA